MSFLQQWFESAKQVVLSPSSFYRETERQEGFGYPVKFAAVSLLISGVLGGLLSLLVPASLLPYMGYGAGATAGFSIMGFLYYVVGAVLFGIIGLFISAAFIHIFVYLFGGRGYQNTFEVLSYATAISAFFGWIPLVNILAGLYAIYVQARGLEAFHELSFGKALAAVLLPVVIVLALVLVMFAAIASVVLASLAMG